MEQVVTRTRLGVSLGVGQVEVFTSAAARATVLEAERVAQVAAGLLPADVSVRPTRLAELLVTGRSDRAAVHAVLRDVAEAQAQLHALQAAAVSRLAALQPTQERLPGARADDPSAPDRPDDWVADEVAVVLGISVGSASALVDEQRVLAEQLPRVWAALADGEIDVRRCQVLVDALGHRKRSAGGGMDDDVVDHVAALGLAWIGEGLGPTPLADRVAGALIAADPAEAARRAERRRRKQNVTTVGSGDGLAGLRADLLDAADAAAMQSVVDAMAAVMRKGGDRRPIGQLRVDALRQLLTRPWETLPEDVARASWQLRLRVDLADLHDHRDDHPDHLAPVLTAGAAAPAGPAPCAAGAEALDAVAAARGPRTPGTASIGGLSVGPVAVAELLARSGALAGHRTGGRVDGGQVWFEVVDSAGRLRAVASPSEARSAHRRGAGLGPPPEVQGYVPSAAQVRFVKARDQHCRFPGCHRPADLVDLDHVVPRDHHDPGAGGPTCVTNLACLCRRHHRLKTHAPGWAFAMDADGTLHVTPPGGRTRTTRPVAVAEAHVAAGTQPDTFTELFGRTPRQYRTPTPEERARRRATAAERAGVAAEIDGELEVARARRAAQGLEVAGVAPVHDEPPF